MKRCLFSGTCWVSVCYHSRLVWEPCRNFVWWKHTIYHGKAVQYLVLKIDICIGRRVNLLLMYLTLNKILSIILSWNLKKNYVLKIAISFYVIKKIRNFKQFCQNCFVWKIEPKRWNILIYFNSRRIWIFFFNQLFFVSSTQLNRDLNFRFGSFRKKKMEQFFHF